ncbi:hypothetical protein EE612_046159, partial [Oryza sativa]
PEAKFNPSPNVPANPTPPHRRRHRRHPPLTCSIPGAVRRGSGRRAVPVEPPAIFVRPPQLEQGLLLRPLRGLHLPPPGRHLQQRPRLQALPPGPLPRRHHPAGPLQLHQPPVARPLLQRALRRHPPGALRPAQPRRAQPLRQPPLRRHPKGPRPLRIPQRHRSPRQPAHRQHPRRARPPRPPLHLRRLLQPPLRSHPGAPRQPLRDDGEVQCHLLRREQGPVRLPAAAHAGARPLRPRHSRHRPRQRPAQPRPQLLRRLPLATRHRPHGHHARRGGQDLPPHARLLNPRSVLDFWIRSSSGA